MMGILGEDQSTFMIVFRSFLLRMRNIFSDKFCTGNQNAYFVFSNLLFIIFLKIRSICEIMWNNVVGSDRAHMTM